jgi:abortive infection bacteriophage resistance protein
MCFETSTLSLVSKLYENLKMSKEKKQVARNFFMHPYVLESWMHTLSVVRNICAHHGRLWNRKIPAAPKMLKNPKQTWLTNRNIETNKMYMVLSSIIYLLDSIIPDHNFKNKFINLLTKYPVISESEMGFPEHWKQEALWK